MMSALRSEMRKVLSVRSTYVIFGLGLLLVIFMNGWAGGYKHFDGVDSGFIAGLISSTLKGTSALLGLIVLLQVTQEYRYNTIYYTLTLTRQRHAVLLAKALTASVVMLIAATLYALAATASGVIGLAASGDSMVAQSIPWGDIFTKGTMYVWGAGMYALIIGFLLRNQVGGIVIYLFGAMTAEGILGILLKTNSGYLPFTALEGIMMDMKAGNYLSPEKSMAVVLVWVITAGLAAWFLFKKRDAN